MTGSYVLKEVDSFEGTDLVASSRWIRFTGVKPSGDERFVLYGVDNDPCIPELGTGAIIADKMGKGLVRLLCPDGRFACWGFYAPIEGSTNVNPVGNWLSMDVDVSYDIPLFDVAEVRAAMKSPERFKLYSREEVLSR